jgi:integrase
MTGLRDAQRGTRDNTQTLAEPGAAAHHPAHRSGEAVAVAVVAHNVVRELRSRRRRGKERQAERRERGKLQVGVDIPSPAEIKAILAAARGRWRPLLLTVTFCGLRASELRGLRWSEVDFRKGELHVRQRADRFNDIGKPKSEAGERAVPIPPGALNALKAWKLECPKGKFDLVFPNGAGKIENHGNIVTRGLWPIEIAAGVADIVKDEHSKVVIDEDGKKVMRARYTGLHSFRHFFASWCINRKVDGGLELPAKVVQERLGHSTVVLTLDRYGHLRAPSTTSKPASRVAKKRSSANRVGKMRRILAS